MTDLDDIKVTIDLSVPELMMVLDGLQSLLGDDDQEAISALLARLYEAQMGLPQ